MKRYYFEKIIIKSYDDLPKKSGYYEVAFNDGKFCDGIYFDIKDEFASASKVWWLNKVGIWFRPISECESKDEIVKCIAWIHKNYDEEMAGMTNEQQVEEYLKSKKT